MVCSLERLSPKYCQNRHFHWQSQSAYSRQQSYYHLRLPVYLLCSDGLSDLVKDVTIAKILLDADNNITFAANKLIETANENGGSDNISVIIARVNKSFVTEKNWVKSLFKSK